MLNSILRACILQAVHGLSLCEYHNLYGNSKELNKQLKGNFGIISIRFLKIVLVSFRLSLRATPISRTTPTTLFRLPGEILVLDLVLFVWFTMRLVGSSFLKDGPNPASFSFVFVAHNFFVVSRIQTQIIGVGGKHANHQTTSTALALLCYCSFYYVFRRVNVDQVKYLIFNLC